MDDFPIYWSFSVPIVAIGAAFVYAVVHTIIRGRVRELEVRERIAMIERGLVPPPEKDPAGFDRAMNRYERQRDGDQQWGWRRRPRSSSRYRSAGITMMGVGVGLALLIGMTGDATAGIGVGGFLAVVGFAFLVNSLFAPRQDDYYSSYARNYPPPPPPPSEPPR
jgi:hypothetical protein